MGPTWGQLGLQNLLLMLKNRLKRAFQGHRRRFFGVLKKHLNIEGSGDRFSIDCGRSSGSPGEAKMWFLHVRGYNFHIFGDLNISCLLETQKHRFWVRLGVQVGVRKRTSWFQEANISALKLFFGDLNFSQN